MENTITTWEGNHYGLQKSYHSSGRTQEGTALRPGRTRRHQNPEETRVWCTSHFQSDRLRSKHRYKRVGARHTAPQEKPPAAPRSGGEAVYKAHRANSRKPRKAVMDAMAALWAEYGERFPQVLKTITVGNGSGFAGFAQTEVWGSIEPFTDEDILASADGMNGRPRRKLGYCTPEELFEAFLDTVYTA